METTAAVTDKKPKFYQKRTFKKYVFIFTLLLWPMLHFLVFWVYINGRTFMLMFQQFDRYGMVTGTPLTYYFVGFDNIAIIFKQFFFPLDKGGDILLRNALLNSLKAFPLNNFIILPLAFLLSFILYKKVRGAYAFRVIFYLPSIVSIVALTMAYKYMFDARFGPLYKLFDVVFGYTPDWFSVLTKSNTIWPLIFFYCIWAGMGGNVILISGAMSRIPKDILEYGRLDGIGFWRECFQIVLPLIAPTLSTLFVMGTMGIFGFMMQPYLLAGAGGGYNGQTFTISLYIFNLVTNNSSKGASVTAASTGMVFCVLGTPIVFLIKWLTEKVGKGIDY